MKLPDKGDMRAYNRKLLRDIKIVIRSSDEYQQYRNIPGDWLLEIFNNSLVEKYGPSTILVDSLVNQINKINFAEDAKRGVVIKLNNSETSNHIASHNVLVTSRYYQWYESIHDYVQEFYPRNEYPNFWAFYDANKFLLSSTLAALQVRHVIKSDSYPRVEDYNLITLPLREAGFILHPKDTDTGMKLVSKVK